ncbi:MAG: sulfatase-like hydrolase/transferase, partial [Firmicutes bacterium]|nr:sulfatase-like hydrolase/transferase [Bacillota bacterium]
EQYPSDAVMIPEITKMTLERIENGDNLFSFHVTMQNHGPYNTTLNDYVYPYVPLTDAISEEDHAVINNYLDGIVRTNDALKIMIEEFGDCEEPIVLVLFGDHKPSLGNNGCTYDALGISRSESDEEGFYATYETEYLIWANDAAKDRLENDFVGEGPTVSPCFLMNVLFEQCGWEGPAYMKLTDEVMDDISVISAHNRYLTQDGLIFPDALTEEQKILLQKMDLSQFYLAHDYDVE